MTKPTTTTNSAAAIAQVLSLQSRRISKMEATLTRIETMLEQTHPMRSDEGREPHATAN